MILSWLELRDFRVHRELSFSPDPAVNLLVGDNGSGKTSVLEAIGYLATLRSFRRSPDAAVVRVGAPAAVVRGEFRGTVSTVKVEIENPAEGRRRVLLDGKPARSRSEVAEHVDVVAFLPDDLDLVKRGPAYRREWMDDLAVMLWPGAASEQQDLERAVRQRNALLKKEGRRADLPTLDVWDQRLSVLGAAVLRRRLEALDLAGPHLAAVHSRLAGDGEALAWEYRSTVDGVTGAGDDLQALMAEALASARPMDLERRVTTVGPHRDDLELTLGPRDVRTRASQGEQRSVALGLRLLAATLSAERRGVAPVVLLDDVFSELDPERGKRLVDLLPPGQVFITSAHPAEVPLRGAVWAVSEDGLERSS
jgi:DNA replication and repair protein RecF